MSARVWITRARPGAERTAERLRGLGLTPVIAPLLVVEPLRPALPDLENYDGLVFTSSNGVDAFAALTPRRDRPVLAVGDATADAARRIGFQDVRSAAGDLTDLARLIAAPIKGLPQSPRLLAAVAETPAGDLAAAVSSAGGTAQIDTITPYRTAPAIFAPPTAFDAVLVHSPRAGRQLATLDAARLAKAEIVCISPAAAAPLAALGLAPTVAQAPNEPALFTGLQEALGKRERRV